MRHTIVICFPLAKPVLPDAREGAEGGTRAERPNRAMIERTFNNKLRHGKRHFDLAGLDPQLVGATGARFERAVLDPEVGPEIVLLLIDSTPFAYELHKRTPFELRLKLGVARTSAGPIAFLLWWIPPITNGKPFALYEHMLNPSYPKALEGLRQIAHQTHFHVILLGPGQELLAVYEFGSTFGLENLIPFAEKACKENSAVDFAAAQQEYRRTYDLMELFSLDEPSLNA